MCLRVLNAMGVALAPTCERDFGKKKGVKLVKTPTHLFRRHTLES